MQDARLVEAAPAEITAEDSVGNIKSQTNCGLLSLTEGIRTSAKPQARIQITKNYHKHLAVDAH